MPHSSKTIVYRLQSLSLVVPLFYFLIAHTLFLASSLGGNGIHVFNEKLAVHFPFRVLAEILFLYLPILLHAGFFISQSRFNVHGSPVPLHGSLIRSHLKQITFIIGFSFLTFHVISTRILPVLSSESMDYLWMVRVFSNSGMAFFYAVGSLSLTYYILDSLWGTLIDWGLLLKPKSQLNALKLGGIILFIVTLILLIVIVKMIFHYGSAPSALQNFFEFLEGYLF